MSSLRFVILVAVAVGSTNGQKYMPYQPQGIGTHGMGQDRSYSLGYLPDHDVSEAPNSGTAPETSNQPRVALACLCVQLVWGLMWVYLFMFNHKLIFKGFKLENHSLAEVLIEKDSVPMTSKIIRSQWTQRGQLNLLFLIVAITEACMGELKFALLTTFIFQAGQSLFLLKDHLLNPFGFDDELAKNSQIRVVIALSVVIAGVQCYGWSVAPGCD